MHNSIPLITTIVGGLVLAFILVMLANRLRISPLVGYLAAGVLAGPFYPRFCCRHFIGTVTGGNRCDPVDVRCGYAFFA